MKILFIGTVKLSLKKLELLINLKQNIVGVITLKESDFHSDYADLTPLCKKHNIDVFYSNSSINDSDCLGWIKQRKPDIAFCFGWSQIIEKELLDIPKKGVVGFHPAKLPKNRGRHPIIWALVLGLESTGSTFFQMDEGADSGDIISQVSVNISVSDTARDLYEKITDVSLQQIRTFLPLLISGEITLEKQDHKKVNYWRKRSKNDGLIDFRMSSRMIYNLVRALTHPYIGAHIMYKNTKYKVWEAEEVLCSDKNIEPGKVMGIDHENQTISIKCGENVIKLVSYELTSLLEKGMYL